ncbi:MAG: hypothetical protein R2710_01685 [Acidimicrobiales bacterium]
MSVPAVRRSLGSTLRGTMTERRPHDSQIGAEQRTTSGVYRSIQSLIRFDPAEQWQLLRHLALWIVLGSAVGVLAGGSSAAFLTMLTWATDTAPTTGGCSTCSPSPV